MFATVEEARKPRRWRALTLSVVVHGVIAFAALGAALWQVPAIAEPPLNDVFSVALPAPAEEHRSVEVRHTAAAQPPSAPPAATVTPQQPQQVPDQLPTREENTSPALQTATAPPATEGGDSLGTDPGPAAGSDPVGGDDGGPIRIDGRIVKPEIIPGTRIEPRYTESARRVRLEGTVVLEAIIDQRGEVVNLHPLRSLPLGLTEAAIEAVRQWRFRPATLFGKPVKVYFTVTVQFHSR
jgi:protein TonB